jgi:hypothetical protein
MEKTGLYLLLLMTVVYSQHTIVTLRKENKVLCNTEDVTLPTFISPPFLENSTKSLSLLTGKDWTYDNWILTDASNSTSGSVTDKRWESFQVTKTNYKTFTYVQSVSFSLHSPVEVEVFVNDYEDLDYTHLKESREGWCHISIYLINNHVFYWLNNKVIKSMVAFTPHEVTVKTKNDTIWKIHDYKYMMSENVTDGKHTTLTLPRSENSCFLLYVSLCAKCVLTIPELNKIYNSTNDPSFINSWQVYQLETDIENVTFYKTTTDNSTLGYWGIDLHECPEKVVHKVNASEIEENNYLCYVLKDEYKMERQMEQNSKNVNVESCEDRSCECIWGYTDSSRNTNGSYQKYCKGACDLCSKLTSEVSTKECEKRHWGPSCFNTCQEGCEKCNRITGECTDNINKGTIIGITFGVILLLIGIIVFVVVKRKFLWNQYLKWRYHGIPNTYI